MGSRTRVLSGEIKLFLEPHSLEHHTVTRRKLHEYGGSHVTVKGTVIVSGASCAASPVFVSSKDD